jgi:23S rRNA (guanine745-N1)-methyltransferase
LIDKKNMFELRCTVRNCPHLLTEKETGLHCEAGHHFDRPKGGYWNLLQPQDKKSLTPGDSEDAVLARHRWLDRGLAEGLVEALKPWIESPSQGRAMDLGCGEGTFGPALFSDWTDGYCGVDLSKRAIRLAAQRWKEGTWVLANADRFLPAADDSVDCVVSLFGRRPAAEIARVLKPGGRCIVAVPGEEDLIQLREQVQQTGRRRSRWEIVVEELEAVGLKFKQHQLWKTTVDLQPDAIADALAMTYRAVRRSQHDRAQHLEAMQVTLAADLILFERSVS